jgi:predicted 2-oxoglutarate/Fe(II)-dependent dioxygenase YbiX
MFERVADYVHVENVIPKQVCRLVLEVISGAQWQANAWFDYATGKRYSEAANEPDLLFATPDIQAMLHPSVVTAAEAYTNKFAYPDSGRTRQIVTRFSYIRFNRYTQGQVMRKHHDHIHSIFDGRDKGIPVLSFVGNLNEDYEGGELAFFDGSRQIGLKTGDICMFPSCFLYPHEVREVRTGCRYSFAAWGW